MLAGCRQPPEKLNLLLVTLDTVRADHLGCYGDRAAETPNLDRLAGAGIRFEHAESAVPLTLPSHSTILSGLLPPRHGVRNNGAGRFPSADETLATRLKAAGWRTGGFVGAFVLDHRFGLDRGFDVYDDDIPRGPGGPQLESERPGSVVVDRSLAWLGASDPRPFFAWVHLYDAHAPYTPPEPFKSRHPDAPYDGEIASVDYQIGRLLDWLVQHGLAERTIVAVVGDHGEALGEHGELTHGLLLYEPTLRVPLLLRGPGLPAGAVLREPIGLADLAPTLADLAGAPFPAAPARDGRDLASAVRHGAEPAASDVYSETEYPRTFGWSDLAALRRGPLKLIAAPRAELYDLGRDPGEAHDLASQERRAAADLAASLGPLRRETGPKPAATALDAEAQARLESLGYVTPRTPPPTGAALANPRERVQLFRRFEEAHWAELDGRTAESTAILSQLVEADPANPVFRSYLARSLRVAGQLDRAIALYRDAAALAPQDAQAWHDLAVALQEAGRPRDAASALAEALRRDPDRPESHNALGIALSLEGKIEEGRAEFARATELDPRSPTAWNNLGNALRDLQRYDEAAAAYERAIALAPSYPDPLNGLGVLDVQRGRPAAALPLFDRALHLAPGLHETRLNRAVAFEMLGDQKQAVVAYREFLDTARDDPQFEVQRKAAEARLAGLLTRTKRR